MVTEVAVPSLLSTGEAVGVGGAGDELVVGAGRRCRSRRRWRRSRTCRSEPAASVWVWKVAGAVDVADGQRAGGADVGARHWSRSGCGRRRDTTAASLVPRMLMVTEVAVPSLLSTREAVGIGGAGDELVVCAGRRCRSRRRWRRSRTCRSEPAVWSGLERRRAVDVADGQRAGGADGGRGIGLGQVAMSADTTAASLVPRMLMVTEVAVPSLLSTGEGVGIGDAGGELVVGAGRRCRSRRRWRRSRTCRRGR